MENEKRYIVKLFEVNPFSKDLKNSLVLCDVKTMDPFCDIESGMGSVKEGDILGKNDFTARYVSKKAKHLVAGDTIQTEDRMYHGVISSIEWNEYDFYSSKVNVKDLHLSPQGVLFEDAKQSASENTFELREISPISWISATIKCPQCGR